jgi:hypothetical protein
MQTVTTCAYLSYKDSKVSILRNLKHCFINILQAIYINAF